MSCSFCGVHNITDSSIYLTRGGAVSMQFGSLRAADVSGYSWAATPLSGSTHALALYFDHTTILVSHGAHRWLGFTVRVKVVFQFLAQKNSPYLIYI